MKDFTENCAAPAERIRLINFHRVDSDRQVFEEI